MQLMVPGFWQTERSSILLEVKVKQNIKTEVTVYNVLNM